MSYTNPTEDPVFAAAEAAHFDALWADYEAAHWAEQEYDHWRALLYGSLAALGEKG